MLDEKLYVTDSHGAFISVEKRKEILPKLRECSYLHGDAGSAVMCVYLLLLTSKGELRLVQRSGDKKENPDLLDKSVGGHVSAVCPFDQKYMQQIFDMTLRRECAEEIGLDEILMLKDNDFVEFIKNKEHCYEQYALITQLEHDPWYASLRTVKNGKAWIKRHNVAIYMGVFDGEFEFRDAEALVEKSIDLNDIDLSTFENNELYTKDLQQLIKKYLPRFKSLWPIKSKS